MQHPTGITATGMPSGMDKVKDDFGKVKSGVADLAGSAADAARAGAKDAVDAVKDKAGDAQKYAEQQIEALVQCVKDRPVTSALVGVGIGFLLAKLLSR
jgi:ElaB/YqjD/DUF883 family membrane-anchored ribosome-binding protein